MPAPDFDAEDLRRDHGLLPDDRASLRSAATWLQAAVAFNAVGTILCSCPALALHLAWNFPNDIMAFLGGMGLVVLWLVLLVVMGAGPRHLRERRGYWLALASGILAFPAALFSLAQCAYLVWEARPLRDKDVFAVVMLVLALGLVCTLTALVAGLKTLAALSRPEVKRSFR
jgi:tryptophan-rich sensory protein